MNFVGFVIGVEDRNYSVTGSDQVLLTTGRDADTADLRMAMGSHQHQMAQASIPSRIGGQGRVLSRLATCERWVRN